MDKLLEMLNKIGLPFAYDHFVEGESPEPPFLIYLIPKRDDFKADGRNYYKVQEIMLELYADKKDLVLEEKLEQILEEYGICYERSETWIPSEKLYEVLYTFYLEVK